MMKDFRCVRMSSVGGTFYPFRVTFFLLQQYSQDINYQIFYYYTQSFFILILLIMSRLPSKHYLPNLTVTANLLYNHNMHAIPRSKTLPEKTWKVQMLMKIQMFPYTTLSHYIWCFHNEITTCFWCFNKENTCFLPLVVLMMGSIRRGYLVMRWVTSRMHSGTPFLLHRLFLLHFCEQTQSLHPFHSNSPNSTHLFKWYHLET